MNSGDSLKAILAALQLVRRDQARLEAWLDTLEINGGRSAACLEQQERACRAWNRRLLDMAALEDRLRPFGGRLCPSDPLAVDLPGERGGYRCFRAPEGSETSPQASEHPPAQTATAVWPLSLSYYR